MTVNGQPQKTPYLDRYTVDMVARLRPNQDDFVAYGREKEIRSVAVSLLRLNKNSPVLVGEAGVGKTRIVEGFAVACLRKEVPKEFHNIKLRVLELSSLQAVTVNHKGEKEDMIVKMKHIVNELKENRSDNILFIDEVHTVMGTGAVDHSTLDVANLLKPALSRGEIMLISATTFDEFREIEKDPAMERRLQPIFVDEPGRDDAVKILEGLKHQYERKRGVTITADALTSAVDLSMRYMADKRLPDKAIDLIDEAVSIAYLDGRERVDGRSISKVLSNRKHIPLYILEGQRRRKQIDLVKQLGRVIKGQDHAVTAISNHIYAGQVGLRHRNRPIASFFLLGTTGVGKTELCRQVARLIYGSVDNMTRIDCSEYKGKDALARLIGNEETGAGGYLTEAVKRKPYQLILFDELEKSDSDVKNLLLQVLDAGRLTDSRGRLIDFKETIIVATSNSGHAAIKSKYIISGNFSRLSDKERKVFHKDVLTEVKKDFREELVNRWEEIIIMNMLDEEVAAEIVSSKLEQIERDLLKEHGLTISYEDRGAFHTYLEHIGVDAENGARPLERVLRETIILPIGKQLYFLDRGRTDQLEVHISLEGDAPRERNYGNGKVSVQERRRALVNIKKCV